MYVLAIETTGAFASVVLMKDGEVIGHIAGNDRFSHLQNIMPQIRQVTADNQLAISDVNAVAVSCGPGSFTGIRIGVSTARALAQVMDIPCVAVSSLEALAMRADGKQAEASADHEKHTSPADHERSTPPAEHEKSRTLICPILDARRSQVYGGGYYLEDGYPVEEIKAGPYTIEEFMAAVSGYDNVLLLGDAADVCSEKIKQLRPKGAWTAAEDIRYQDAVTVGKLGCRLLEETGGVKYYDVKPEYMRLAEAERKLREQQSARSTQGSQLSQEQQAEQKG